MPGNEQTVRKSPGIEEILPKENLPWRTILKIVFVIMLFALAIYLFLNPEGISESVNSFIENIGPTG
ncbi:hypothetical protein HYV84_05310 [Candidatus Woesearchaeota archaeon]|nr:hypothetical protein [Candidatus Woesearchaeota archaeon]